MICKIRPLTRLQCDHMNLFILKIQAPWNRIMTHPLRHVLFQNTWLSLVVLRPSLCHNESNMEIQVLLLLLIFEPLTISHPFLRYICVMSSEEHGSVSSAAYRLQVFPPSFTRQFLEEHWHKQPEGVVARRGVVGGGRRGGRGGERYMCTREEGEAEWTNSVCNSLDSSTGSVSLLTLWMAH